MQLTCGVVYRITSKEFLDGDAWSDIISLKEHSDIATISGDAYSDYNKYDYPSNPYGNSGPDTGYCAPPCYTLEAAAPSQTDTMVQTQVDWPAFLARHDMVWDVLPNKFDYGAFLGNGMLGATIYQEGDNRLRFEMGRSDVTEHRRDNSRLPIGGLVLTTAGKIKSGAMRLDLWNAEVRDATAYSESNLPGIRRLYLSIADTFPGNGASAEAVAQVRQSMSADFDSLLKAHREWWNALSTEFRFHSRCQAGELLLDPVV